jgi:hypothetical protein
MKGKTEKQHKDIMDFNFRLPGWVGRKVKTEAKAMMIPWSARLRQIVVRHYEREAEKVEAR